MTVYKSNHNSATNTFKTHYISYNFGDRYIYGCDTTAIVIGQMQRFYILNGNHYDKLINLSFSDCMEYFIKNCNVVNRLSDVYCEKNASDIIDAYEKFKIEKGYI